MKRVGLLEIHAVNVLGRAHYFPPFSRIGPYPTEWLDDLAPRKRRLFEYWGHAASLIPVDLFSSFRWRMERAKQDIGVYPREGTFSKHIHHSLHRAVYNLRHHRSS